MIKSQVSVSYLFTAKYPIMGGWEIYDTFLVFVEVSRRGQTYLQAYMQARKSIQAGREVDRHVGIQADKWGGGVLHADIQVGRQMQSYRNIYIYIQAGKQAEIQAGRQFGTDMTGRYHKESLAAQSVR